MGKSFRYIGLQCVDVYKQRRKIQKSEISQQKGKECNAYKKYKTYYIKVVAKIKVGKKTVSNDAQLINYNY